MRRPRTILSTLAVIGVACLLPAAARPEIVAPDETLPEPSARSTPAVPSTTAAQFAIDPGWTVARVWNEALLAAIRMDRPKPPIHARNLFHLSVAMWDAWATFDPTVVGYLTTEKHAAADVEGARKEAISYAAYRLLMHRFPGSGIDPGDRKLCQPGAFVSQGTFTATLAALGYDPDFTSTDGDSPAAIGNRIGQAVIDYGLSDGANEGEVLCYPDDTGYFAYNPDLIFKLPGTGATLPNHWQPLAFDFLVLQNGIIIGAAVQSFVGVGWADVKPFALTPLDRQQPGQEPTGCAIHPTAEVPYLPAGCPPQLGADGDQEVRDAMVELIAQSASVDPGEGRSIDISPGVHGNNPLGSDGGSGYPANPFTCEPYASNVVNLADYARVVAEFWADGPRSETPPGHWNVLANYVTDHLAASDKRLGGTGGPLLGPLEWDVKLYLAMNGAVHDAAIGAWGTKQYFDSSRPITLIRYMGERGQSSDPALPSYDPEGLPLIPGLIELITPESTAPGERHEHLEAFCDVGFNAGLACEVEADCPDNGPFDGKCVSALGEIAIHAWRGSPADPHAGIGGVGWIRASQWMPYQANTFVTPPFPGYTSGHSTFSRASAEVLSRFTGTPFFPGGLGTFVAGQNAFLSFELGPSEAVALQWATYFDASDEAAISRRFGGIHPRYDDYPARRMGSTIGQKAFAKALEFYRQTPGEGNPDPGGCLPEITLCHHSGSGNGKSVTITVSRDALPAHLKHGDTMGACTGAPAVHSPSLRRLHPG
ncbi:MAG TPA: vanadium-dependent haloperoxidase [Candidatus Cryosericum sp.]|nr:vanadium-dependent haloperoxidase [Candidatus Cryosericum sp.]